MDISEIAPKLSKTFNFFNALTDDELSTLLDFCDTKQIDEGDTLWDEGDKSNYAAFIVSGKVGIKKKTEFKGKHMIVGTLGPGTVVGELCLLGDRPRSATVMVLEQLYIVTLSSEKFELLITEHPKLGLKLLKHIFVITVDRLNKSTDRIAKIF